MGRLPPRSSPADRVPRQMRAYRYPAVAAGLVLTAALAFLATASLLSPAPASSLTPPIADGSAGRPTGASGTPPTAPATATASSTVPATGSATASATATAQPSETPTPSARPTRSVGTSASPSPRPTGGSSPTPAVTPSSSPPSVYVTNGSRSSGQVALTFDFGGRVGDALAIVDYLVEHDVAATVFITGAQLDTTSAGPAVLAKLCVRPQQFALGNHSYSHPSFDEITQVRMRTELTTTEAAFAKVCDRTPRPFFRPPNGALGGWQTAKFYEILATVGAAGYGRTVTWDVDTLDWSPDTTAAQIVSYVERGRGSVAPARGGSIVLMHLGGYGTLEALPTIVGYLRGQGYDLVTLHELLGA